MAAVALSLGRASAATARRTAAVPPPPDGAAAAKPRGAPAARSPACIRPHAERRDWLYHHLTISGPARRSRHFAAAARGAGVIPWQLDCAASKRIFSSVPSPSPPRNAADDRRLPHPGAAVPRTGRGASGPRRAPLVGRSGMPVRPAHAAAGAGRHPRPRCRPIRPRWPGCAAHWGVTDRLRQVVAAAQADDRPAAAGRSTVDRLRIFHRSAKRRTAAIAALGDAGRPLRFWLVPRPAGLSLHRDRAADRIGRAANRTEDGAGKGDQPQTRPRRLHRAVGALLALARAHQIDLRAISLAGAGRPTRRCCRHGAGRATPLGAEGRLGGDGGLAGAAALAAAAPGRRAGAACGVRRGGRLRARLGALRDAQALAGWLERRPQLGREVLPGGSRSCSGGVRHRAAGRCHRIPLGEPGAVRRRSGPGHRERVSPAV